MPKQMTDADELAIAKELAFQAMRSGQGFIAFKGYTLKCAGYGTEGARYFIEQHSPSIEYYCHSDSPIETLWQFRQRLAEEREAKKSPREKRLEGICEFFANGYSQYWLVKGGRLTHEQIIEALKED